MADPTAPAEPTQTTYDPATGQYVGYASVASSQGAATAAAPAQDANGDELTRTTWNPATGRYDGWPSGKPPAPRTAPAPPSSTTEPSVVYDAAEFKRRVGRDPEPAELENFAANKGVGWAPANSLSPINQYIQDTLLNPAYTGAEKARQIGSVLVSPARSNEATAESIADAQKSLPPEPEFLRIADQQLAQSKGFFGALDAYLSNPRAAFAKGVQGLVQSVGVVGASTAGGAAGGPAGVVAAAAGSGYLDKYGETILSTLSAHGVNLADKGDVLKALNDAALMSQANTAAAKAGVPAAIINAFSFGIAGRVFGPVASAVGRGVVGKAAGVGAEATSQAAIGAGGEAASQEYTQGKITDVPAIVEAGASQAAMTAPFAIAHARAAAHGVAPAASAPESGGIAPLPRGPLAPMRDPAQAIAAAENAAETDNLGTVVQETAPARRPVVEAGPVNAMEHAQVDAAAAVRAAGGDNLDQVVAATQVNAHLGAVHDAAAVGALRERRMAALEAARQEAENEQAQIDQGLREQGLNAAQQANASAAPAPADVFAKREAQQAAQRDRDFTAARNQQGDQTIEAANQSVEGAERGGANEPAPTLADFLPEGQRAKLEALKARRLADLQAATAAEGREPSVQELMRAQAEGTPDDIRELPAEAPKAPANRLDAIRQAALKRQAATATASEPPTQAKATDVEEELPESGPPPATTQTLAERRQAALDKAMAKKVGRAAAAEESPGEVAASTSRQRTAEGLADLLGRTGKRMAMEEHGQGVLDDLQEKGTPVNEVAKKFWDDTYYKLPAQVQGRFRRMLAEHAGMDNTVDMDVPATVRDRMDLPDNPEHLEGTDRGFVALMDEANLRAAAPESSAQGPRQRTTLSLADQTKGRFADASQAVRPEDVQHSVAADGTHIAETPGGKTTAVERPDGDLQVKSSETSRGVRNAGEGTARVERLAQEAHARGGKLDSDTRVSGPAQRVYEQLRQRGYQIEERPNKVDPGTGEKVSASEMHGVYSVGPRDLTKLTGLQLKRLAHTGDAAAQGEYERRLNTPSIEHEAASESTPPKGTFADRRAAAQTGDAGGSTPRPGAVSKEAVQRHLAPLIERTGGKLRIHDSLADADVPQYARDEAAAGLHDDPRGYFDPATGEMDIFAGSKGHETAADAADTAVHELAHNGIRSYLGKDYADALQDIHDNIHNRKLHRLANRMRRSDYGARVAC